MANEIVSSVVSKSLDRIEVSVNGKKSWYEYSFGGVLRSKFEKLLATHTESELKNMKGEIKEMIEDYKYGNPGAPSYMRIRNHTAKDLSADELKETRRLLAQSRNPLQSAFLCTFIQRTNPKYDRLKRWITNYYRFSYASSLAWGRDPKEYIRKELLRNGIIWRGPVNLGSILNYLDKKSKEPWTRKNGRIVELQKAKEGSGL